MNTKVGALRGGSRHDFIKSDVSIAKGKLVQDFKIVVVDIEELLKVTADVAGEKAAQARARIQESLDRAKVKLLAAETAVLAKVKQTAGATDEYVRQNTWQAMGVFAGIGFLIGLLVSRRDPD